MSIRNSFQPSDKYANTAIQNLVQGLSGNSQHLHCANRYELLPVHLNRNRCVIATQNVVIVDHRFATLAPTSTGSTIVTLVIYQINACL